MESWVESTQQKTHPGTGHPVTATASNDHGGVGTPVAVPAATNDNSIGTVLEPGARPDTIARPGTAANPAPVPHTQTQSTLAPTSEYMRYLLAAWGARYVFRGFFGTLFDKPEKKPFNAFTDEPRLASHAGMATAMPTERSTLTFREKVMNAIEKPGDWIQRKFPHSSRDSKVGLTYNAALGVGSTTLTLNYSKMVYDDIMNIFREEVAEELGKAPQEVTFNDVRHSSNRIVQQTMHNFWSKLGGRLAIDMAFFPAAWTRSKEIGDFVLGLKALQLFADTWKREPTMFEDLVSFVNHKINPTNGLGQPIGLGEVFDLYQHYAKAYQPEKAFRTVLSRDSSEIERMAISQPVFSRITELMNLTYAYKHNNASEADVASANFALPKLIYMLGHDLIDPTNPQQTLAMVEVMNARGAAGVKQAQSMLAGGMPPEQMLAQFNLHFPQMKKDATTDGPNGVIAKGSTLQLDAAPGTVVDKAGLSTAQLAATAAHLAH